jgi:Na+/H+-dicarboxylate symporter
MKKILSIWFDKPLWQKILIALVAGILTGLLLGKHASYLKPIGDIFINAIHMMVVSVVFTAIICAIISAKDSVRMGAVGLV